jgi:hypothetical protein
VVKLQHTQVFNLERFGLLCGEAALEATYDSALSSGPLRQVLTLVCGVTGLCDDCGGENPGDCHWACVHGIIKMRQA